MTFSAYNINLERWRGMVLAEQLANIGSEVARALYWRQKGDNEQKIKSGERALELMDLTITDPRWRGRVREILRLREAFCDMVFGAQEYDITLEQMQSYFLPFALQVRG